MKITDAAIDRRTTVIVLLILILVMGLISYITLPRESEPEVIIPLATVMVNYRGVSPEDMETLVTIPIERKLTGISGVKQIISTSQEGSSVILIEFEPEVDVDEAIQKVRDKIDLAKPDLPDDADEPIIRDTNMAESPIVFVSLTGSIGIAALSKIAEDLEDKIESISGILEVDVTGDVEREIQINVDPIRLGLYGVSLADIVRVCREENVNTPAGTMDVGEAKYLMRVPGEIQRAEDLKNLVVKRGPTGVVYIRDLAEVRDTFKEVSSYLRLDREPSVMLVATKRAGVNIINVANEIRALIDDERSRMPAGVSLDITVDESNRIHDMVNQLENSIFSGLVLVLTVIFMFLGFSNAIFVAMAIPISLLICFIVMSAVGMTLNMVTLFSLMVSLGMLVDNGIVVIENIYRHAQEGLGRVEAAKKGTREVAWPIFGSTLTTIAAFFPMVFWPGMMGRFMNLLPRTVIITLVASLFVGLIVNPALAAIFIRTRKPGEKPMSERPHPILDAYGRFLHLALQWRAVAVTAAFASMVMIVGTYSMNFKYEFLSKTEPDRAYVNIEMPEGTNLAGTDAVVAEIEGFVWKDKADLGYLLASIGSPGASVRNGLPGQDSTAESSHIGRVTLEFPRWDKRDTKPSTIVASLRGAFDDIIGAEIRISESSVGPGSGPPVNIEISGEDFDVLTELTRDIEDAILTVPGLVDLQDTIDTGKPEVRVIIDREQAALADLNTQFIGMTIQAAINGRKAAEFREGDDEYDVIVKFPDQFSDDLSFVEGMSFVNLHGVPIPFSSVARLEQGAGLGSIRRIDRKRTITLSAEAQGRSGPEVLGDVKAILADYPLPPGYVIRYTGENEEVQKSVRFMAGAFVVAIFLIALVLITQFNSIIQPLIIMSSVFLSLGGVFFGLLVFDMPFGVLMTGIGCISLAGIVVNNAIVLVDLINCLIADGIPTEDAIIQAGKTRFRPVLLTAVTTILGLLPLGLGISFDFRKLEMVSGGDQSSYWGAMAIAIIFGLTFATVLTLLVVPVLYSLSVSFVEFFSPKKSPALHPFSTDVPAAVK